MNKKKKSTVICLVLLICLTLAGCGGGQNKKEKIKNLKIGISVYDQYDTYISEMMEYLGKYAEEMERKYDITVTLDIQNAAGKQMTQNDQIDYFIDRNCDIVCVNLVDRTDASTIIERAKSADIPIIFFNRELVEEDLQRWDKLYYVGANGYESGIIQGEILIDTIKKDFASVDRNKDGVLQYVMLEGEVGHQDSIVRTIYSINTVTDAGYELEKLADGIANWNRDQGKTKMVQWIQEFGSQIEVVFSNNDDMALGAIDALEEAGYFSNDEKKNPVVIGIDGTKGALEAVEQGHMLGTVLNDSDGQAKGMLELAYSIVSDEPLDEAFTLQNGKYIRLPYQKIEKEE